jgi:hypothetical protein
MKQARGPMGQSEVGEIETIAKVSRYHMPRATELKYLEKRIGWKMRMWIRKTIGLAPAIARECGVQVYALSPRLYT